MNLTQSRKDILAAVPGLNDEFDQLLARIQVVFEDEHNPQTGEHRNISPTSLTWRGTTVTTVGAAGGASALPATPSGYLQFTISGTTYQLPFYAVA